jgi:alpha-amylase
MKKVHLLLGFHCHQPVGNFDSVFEESTRLAYRPFLDTLERHPSIHVTLHYSGILLEWLEAHDPALLAQIKKLVARGQVEMLTGGFYEPILPIIPRSDRLGQIRKLSAWLKGHLEAEPRGLWLTERVWEPHLPESLAEAGVEFLCADDSHFQAAGLEGEALAGRYVTEEAGKTVEVFPILGKLRALIPFRPPHETLDYLASLASEDGGRCAVMADDGEKFGSWPKTHASVYGEGWLESFFRLLEENAAWAPTATFSEYRSRTRPLGRVYLPAASYVEMMEWALPAASVAPYKAALAQPQAGAFVRAGFWRNFFLKYDEANNLHKKMLWVSDKVNQMPAGPPRDQALAQLWQGQCNCPYWHGVFGGLYLNHLRFANYRHLIAAESLADGDGKAQTGYEAQQADFDCDGRKEVLVQGRGLWAAFDPARGGSLFELDDREHGINVGDTLTRRFEAYHEGLTDASVPAGIPGTQGSLGREQRQALASALARDWYRRSSLLDHCFDPATGLEDFSTNRWKEWGDFIREPYVPELSQDGKKVVLKLSRQGGLWRSGEAQPLEVSKTLTFGGGGGRPGDIRGFQAAYALKNLSGSRLAFRFGVEFNFGLLAGRAPDRYWELEGKAVEGSNFSTRLDRKGLQEFALVDQWLGLRLRFQLEGTWDLWSFPLETVSQSESGFDLAYQGTTLMPHRSLTLDPGQDQALAFRLLLEPAR